MGIKFKMPTRGLSGPTKKIPRVGAGARLAWQQRASQRNTPRDSLGGEAPADQTGCSDFRPASIPSRAGPSQHPFSLGAGRARGPRGGTLRVSPPWSSGRTPAPGSAPPPPDAAAPYLPQHFPAVGAEQVVGRGRRAAATAVHRADAGLSPRLLAEGRLNVLSSGGRAVATAQGLPARARRGLRPRRSPARCSSRPHRQTPARPARTSSRRLSASVQPRPRGPPPSGLPRREPPPPANQTAPATPPPAPAANEWRRPIAEGESTSNLRAS